MNRSNKMLYRLGLTKFSWDSSKFKLRVPGTHHIQNLFTSLEAQTLTFQYHEAKISEFRQILNIRIFMTRSILDHTVIKL